MPVGRSAKGSLGPQQCSQRWRQLLIGVIPDVGVSLPENLPCIDIHGHQASPRGAARIVRGRVDRLDIDVRVGPGPIFLPIADRHEDRIAVPADRSRDFRRRMRIGFRSPDDLTGLLIDRENDGAISRSATQSTRRGPRGEPAKAVNQPHIASDNDQVSLDIRCVAGALRDKTRHREIVHIVLSPDQLPGEAVQFGQVAGHVIEVEKPTVDGRSGRDAALGIACRSRVGYCLVDPLDPELAHGFVVDRPPLETPGILQINSFRECRNLYRPQQQGETLPAFHGRKSEHECLRGHSVGGPKQT